MGINNLQLSPELIAALYSETLVAGDDPDPGKIHGKIVSPVTSPEALFPFLGENIRSICFLVNYPNDEFIPEEQLVFLNKIITACKCSLKDIALVNTAHRPVRLDELKNQLQPRIIFLWGSVPAIIDQDMEFPDMTISQIDGISIVPVLQADIMSRDNKEGAELKQRLWACLKKLFTL